MRRNIKWGIVLIVFGIILQIDKLEILPDITIWKFWPIVVILIGIFMLFDHEPSKTENK